MKGSIPTLAELPTTGEPGDVWYVEANGNQYTWGDADVSQQIAADMTGTHEGIPHGVPVDYEWRTAPFIVMGNNPDGATACNHWLNVYADTTNVHPANTRVQLRNCQVWWKRASTGVWTRGVLSSAPEVEAYAEDYVSGGPFTADQRTETDGSISVKPATGQNVHGFTPFPRVPISATDMGGIVSVLDARLIMANTGGTDDRASARYLVEAGADYYPATTGPGIENNPGVGGGKFKYVTNNWRSYCFSTLSAEELEANPPAITLATGGTGWMDAGHIQGPAGTTGPAGAAGSAGAAGVTAPFRMGYGWTVVGAVTAVTLPSQFVPLKAGQSASLVGLRSKLASGTSVVAQVRRNGSNLGSTITITSTAATTTFNQALTADDDLGIVLTSPTGSPTSLGLTMYLELTPGAPASGFTTDAAMCGYWYMEEATAATRNDGSAKLNHLTQTNGVVQSATKKQGSFSASFAKASSMKLARTDANLSAGFPGKSGSAAQDMTMGCWVQMATVASNMWAMGKGENYVLYFNPTNNKFHAELYDGGTYKSAISNATHNQTATWKHIVLRFMGTTTKEIALFMDGVKQSTPQTAASGVLTSANDFCIGSAWYGGTYWDGLIDEAWIFNRALSDAEILTIFTSGLT
jgi:hypothetical protein